MSKQSMILRTIVLLVAAFALVACDDSNGGNGDMAEIDSMMPCTPGELDCECAAGDTCTTGTCTGGVCVDCMVGSLNCACTATGECANAGDDCVSGLCVARTTCSGDLGCACDAGGGCATADLACLDAVCRPPNSVLVDVSGGDARACDIVVDTSGRHVADGAFPANVRGQTRVRNERGSMALIRTEDTPLEGVVATVILAGDEVVASGDVSLTLATCYDRLGQTDPGVEVSIR